jgi:ankyrin repeat protein
MLHARLLSEPARAVVQGAKLRDAVRSGALDKVHAILTAAGPNASYLVREPEPAGPKWDRQCSERGSSAISEEGYTAVHLAAMMNYAPILHALLEACPCALNSEVERGYSDHQVKKGLTPIMVAARNGYADVVKELVGQNAALNDKLENGKTALLFAAAKGHSGALAALLQEDKFTTSKDAADIDARDHNGAVVPKMWLVEVTLLECHVDVVHVILCSPRRNTHHSPAELAVRTPAELAVRPCTKARCLAFPNDSHPAARPPSADPPTTWPSAPLLPLQGISTAPEHATQVHACLAARRAPPAAQALTSMRCAGDTALHHAVRLERHNIRQDVLDVLLSPQRFKKPNVAAVNKDGLTPLMLAIRNGHGDACDMLLQQQQNLNLTDGGGCTALHCAGARGAPSRAFLCGCRAGWVLALRLVKQARRSCFQQHRRPFPVHSAGPIPPPQAPPISRCTQQLLAYLCLPSPVHVNANACHHVTSVTVQPPHEPCGGRCAALQGNLSIVKTLCDAGANPLAESQVGRRQQACLSMAGSSADSVPCKCGLPVSDRRSRVCMSAAVARVRSEHDVGCRGLRPAWLLHRLSLLCSHVTTRACWPPKGASPLPAQSKMLPVDMADINGCTEVRKFLLPYTNATQLVETDGFRGILNGISIVAVLIVTVTFIGMQTPPGGGSDGEGGQLKLCRKGIDASGHSRCGHNGYKHELAINQDALKAYTVLDGLSLFWAAADLLLVLAFLLPGVSKRFRAGQRVAWVWCMLVSCSLLLAASLVCAVGAFLAAGFTVVPAEEYGLLGVISAFGGVVLLVALSVLFYFINSARSPDTFKFIWEGQLGLLGCRARGSEARAPPSHPAAGLPRQPREAGPFAWAAAHEGRLVSVSRPCW